MPRILDRKSIDKRVWGAAYNSDLMGRWTRGGGGEEEEEEEEESGWVAAT